MKLLFNPRHPMVPRFLGMTLVLLFLALSTATAQGPHDFQVRGTVVFAGGEPVIGATVELEKGRMKTVTDVDGKFLLRLEGRERPVRLVVTYIGMEPEHVMVKPHSPDLVITLHDAANQLQDVVVTGYRTLSKQNMAGSVAVLTGKDFNHKVPTTVDNLLQGLVAGVAVTNGGQPGGSSKIRIRGTNTMEGSAEPLWIVDGVPLQDDLPPISNTDIKAGNFNDLFVHGISGINPNDIDNVTILKDASAAAIYGSRAAGGVIVITTKSGSAGKMKLNYSVNLVSQLKPQRDANLMNTTEKLAWEKELWDEFSAKRLAEGSGHVPVVGLYGMLRSGRMGKNGLLKGSDGYEPMTTDEQDAYLKQAAAHGTNWFDEIFRNTFSMNHHLSLSGGSKTATYYASLGYTGQNGLLRQSSYNRYNMNLKLNLKPTRKLRLQIEMRGVKEKSEEPNPSVDPFKYAYFANPYERPYNADGSYRADMTYFNLAGVNDGGMTGVVLPVNGFNILHELENTSKEANKTTLGANLRLTYDLFDGFQLQGLASYSHDANNSDTVIGADTYTAFNDRLWFDEQVLNWTPYGSILQSNSRGDSYNARLQLNYHKLMAEAHDVALYAGAEIRGNHTERFYTKQYGYNKDTQTVVWPQNPNPSKDDSELYKSLLENLSGRTLRDNRYASFYLAADYMLLNRYMLNMSFRTDGSNNFGSDEQFNPTYSVGLGWHVDKERFMTPLRKVVSRLIVRASGGFTGNVVQGVDKKLVLKIGTTSWNNINTATIKTAPNPRLRWEKTKDAKVSIDLGLLKDRLTVLLDAYYRKSTDVISTSAIVSTTGFSSIKYNASDIVNKGVELTVSGKPLLTRDWEIGLGANMAWNRNYLSRYRSSTGGISDGRYVGYPVASVFQGKAIGIDPYTGMYVYQLRPDAHISNQSDLRLTENYRYYRGTANAPYTGGLHVNARYKRLSLHVGGSFSWGGLISNLMTSPAGYRNVSTKYNEVPQTEYSDLYRNHLNVGKDMPNRWTADHATGTKYPRIIDALGDKLGLDALYPTQSNSAGIVAGTFLEKVNYLKIRDITLAYALPAKPMARIGLSSATFSLTLNNFFTFTNYTGLDPENPGAVYPTTRSMSVNMSVGF